MSILRLKTPREEPHGDRAPELVAMCALVAVRGALARFRDALRCCVTDRIPPIRIEEGEYEAKVALTIRDYMID